MAISFQQRIGTKLQLQAARFLISEQKYLELLEVGNFTRALYILRNELAPLTADLERLRTLSR